MPRPHWVQPRCSYCYASFMNRFTGRKESWGSYVDVKVNAAERLRAQLRRSRQGTVLISSVTDPYQPIEGIWHRPLLSFVVDLC